MEQNVVIPKNRDKMACLYEMRDFIKPGDTIYVLVDRVAPSGMSRVFRLHHFGPVYHKNITERCITLGLGKRVGGGMQVKGCGMDVGWEVVDKLSDILYPECEKLYIQYL